MLRCVALVALAGCAGRTTPATSRSSCPAGGDELYGIDDQRADDSDDAHAKLRVYGNGAWTYQEPERRAERGCLARAELDRIKAALDRTTWMQIATPGPCTTTENSTIYYVNGAAVYETVCSATLDEPTRAAIDEIASILRLARRR